VWNFGLQIKNIIRLIIINANVIDTIQLSKWLQKHETDLQKSTEKQNTKTKYINTKEKNTIITTAEWCPTAQRKA
jgi:hypothetical protein